MSILFVVAFVSFYLLAILALATILVFASAAVMHWFPSSKLTAWLNYIWFDPVEQPDDIYNAIAGDCITPRGDKNGTN